VFIDGDKLTSPFCCYGNNIDCNRCGAWGVFFSASRLNGPWDDVLPPQESHRIVGSEMTRSEAIAVMRRRGR
jgi:hypothetical protein